MKTREDIQTILSEIDYHDWEFLLRYDDKRPYLQLRFFAQDSKCEAHWQEWTGRKWFLSPYMTKSEIVATAYKAVMSAVEHEVKEFFKYKERPIFDPHTDVDALWYACKDVDIRKAEVAET